MTGFVLSCRMLPMHRFILFFLFLILTRTPLVVSAQERRLGPLVATRWVPSSPLLGLPARPGAGTTLWGPVVVPRVFTTAVAWDAGRRLLWQSNETVEGPNLYGFSIDGKYRVLATSKTASAAVPSNPGFPVTSGLGTGIACMPDPTGPMKPRLLMITDFNGDLARIDDNAFVWDPDLGPGPCNVRAYYILDDVGPCIQGSKVVPCLHSTNSNNPKRRITGVTGIAAWNCRHDTPGNTFLVASYRPQAAPPIQVVEFTDGAPGLWRIKGTLVNPIGSSVGGIDFDPVNQRFWLAGIEDGMVYEVAYDTGSGSLEIEQCFPAIMKKLTGVTAHDDQAWPHVVTQNLAVQSTDSLAGVDSGNKGFPRISQSGNVLTFDASRECHEFGYVLLFSFTALNNSLVLDAERTLGHDFDALFIFSLAGLFNNVGSLDPEGRVEYTMPPLPPGTRIPASILVLDPVPSRSTHGIKLVSPVFTYKA